MAVAPALPAPDAFGGRIQMSCPTNARASVARLTQRNKNKHRRLFDGGEGSLKVREGALLLLSRMTSGITSSSPSRYPSHTNRCMPLSNLISSSALTTIHLPFLVPPPPPLVQDGDIVSYMIHGAKLLTGTIVIPEKGVPGIRCDHCDTVVSCSAFENHAGHGQRRNPYDGITTAEGLTLRQIASRLPSLPDAYVAAPSAGGGGGGKRIGKKAFGSAMAEALGAVSERCNEVLSQLDTLASACIICYQVCFRGLRREEGGETGCLATRYVVRALGGRRGNVSSGHLSNLKA